MESDNISFHCLTLGRVGARPEGCGERGYSPIPPVRRKGGEWDYILLKKLGKLIITNFIIRPQSIKMQYLKLKLLAILQGKQNLIDEYERKAQDLYIHGRYQEAMDLNQEIFTLDNKNRNAWNNQRNLFWKMGDNEKSIKCYEMALLIDPYTPNPWSNMSFPLLALGKYEDVIKVCDIATQLDPQDYLAWRNKAIAHAFRNESDLAEECEQRVSEILDKKGMKLDFDGYGGPIK